MRAKHRFTLTLGGLALAAAPVAAQAAEADLMNVRASSGESALESRGYVFITAAENGVASKHAYWWRASDRKCIEVVTRDGVYAAIRDATAADCHQKAGSGTAAAAVGAVAGAVILGALLSHKQHHHEDGQHAADHRSDSEFERGYNDGMHNVPYHDADRSAAYAKGYGAGVDQRDSNTRTHSGRGGNTPFVAFADVQGARAAGAETTLDQRGFFNVDSFKSGTAAYSIWWRSASRQCLQMIVADGHVEDIRDIEVHPKCR